MRRRNLATGDTIMNIASRASFVQHLCIVPLMLFLAVSWQIELLANTQIAFLDTAHEFAETSIHITTLLVVVGNLCVPAAQFLHREKTAEMYEAFLHWVCIALVLPHC